MQMMVPEETVIVVRGGKRTKPPIGKAFPFTDDEVLYLRQNRPEAIRTAKNEMQGTEEETLASLPSDEEVHAENAAKIEAAQDAAIQKAGEKVLTAAGAGKAVKDKKAAAAKVDDL